MSILADKEIQERQQAGLPFRCPSIFREGIARYQMTCDDCPDHILDLCKKNRLMRENENDLCKKSSLMRRNEI